MLPCNSHCAFHAFPCPFQVLGVLNHTISLLPFIKVNSNQNYSESAFNALTVNASNEGENLTSNVIFTIFLQEL